MAHYTLSDIITCPSCNTFGDCEMKQKMGPRDRGEVAPLSTLQEY